MREASSEPTPSVRTSDNSGLRRFRFDYPPPFDKVTPLVLRTERFLLEIAPHGPSGRHLSTPPQFLATAGYLPALEIFLENERGLLREGVEAVHNVSKTNARTPISARYSARILICGRRER